MKNLLPNNSNKSSKGFTLVELMVVIAILALLATVGITIYSGAQKQGRDSKRKADIDSISSALESRINQTTNGTCTGAAGTYCAPVATWFSGGTIPLDPSSSASYTGLPTNGAATYNVCATLEAGGTYCRANQQ
jgi:prepilin-type N-terminal cleavage/methylation domain-containing protein